MGTEVMTDARAYAIALVISSIVLVNYLAPNRTYMSGADTANATWTQTTSECTTLTRCMRHWPSRLHVLGCLTARYGARLALELAKGLAFEELLKSLEKFLSGEASNLQEPAPPVLH